MSLMFRSWIFGIGLLTTALLLSPELQRMFIAAGAALSRELSAALWSAGLMW